MISKEQIERAEKEFASAARLAFEKAKCAERILEDATYAPSRTYDPNHRQKFLEEYRDADYEAESRAFILGLIRKASQKSGIPHNAVCFFQDGDETCAVFGDFVNLQESPAGFGANFEEAMNCLQKKAYGR